jgi:hypothetical protein
VAGARAINLDELQRALTAADPAAFFVPTRLLRRVIRRDRGVLFLGRHGALLTCYTIAGPALGAIVRPSELGQKRPDDAWPETVLLLERPDPDDLATAPPEAALEDAWRRLFRARAQAEVAARVGDGEGPHSPAIAGRIERVGRTEFEEARNVLAQDGLVLPPRSDAAAYAAFAAHFLELNAFAPTLRKPTFPGVEDPASVEAQFRLDVDAEALLAATRVRGASDPSPTVLTTEEISAIASESESPDESGADQESEAGPSESAGVAGVDGTPASAFRRDPGVVAKARAAAASGNAARAAVLWARAIDPAEAREALRQLAGRLQAALFFPEPEVDVWADALTPLLRRAARGFWVPEARLLHDLQKVCHDHEREAYRVDAVRWALSLGRQPLRQPLPHLREVTMSSHLRSAAKRLPKVRLTRDDRARLEALLRPAARRAELALRDRFRPRIDEVLRATWVGPADLPERVAYRKLVEELLDQIVRRGFTTLGDLRDAASKSDLKQHDLSGPRDFREGGRLLKTDRALAAALDGVHRRGEVYLRWLQRLSMLAFGTPLGRLLTLYVVLPYGGAYVALEGLQHLIGWPLQKLTGVHPHLMNTWSLLSVGTVALGGINFVRFRSELVELAVTLGRSLRAVLLDWPARLLSAPWLQRLLRSRAALWAWRFGLKPGGVAAAVWLLARLAGAGAPASDSALLGVFLAVNLLVNTPPGRALEELIAEAAVRAWRELAHDLLPGLFRLVMDTFARVVEAVERVLYAVDEWMRFRTGQSRASLAGKALLMPLWLAVAYVARFAVNLLVEPQINPIKHFPVVTVSHKLLLPLNLTLPRLLAPYVGMEWAVFIVGTTLLVLPGVFGFLVWELKANWRLYEANRPGSLVPVVMGSHGETVVRLLRPGLHSGTLPKTFARLRRAWRRSWPGPGRGRPEKAALKQREALHHVEEAVRSFAERDLIALLAESRSLGGAGITAGRVRLSTNRIRLELLRPDREHVAGDDAPGLWIDLEERCGVLAAGVSEPGWLAALSAEERQTLDDALTGLFKKSGVELVQTPGAPVPRPGEAEPSSPTVAMRDGKGRPETPPIQFSDVVVAWRVWVNAWEAEQAGDRAQAPLAGGRGVLPSPTLDAATTPPRPYHQAGTAG